MSSLLVKPNGQQGTVIDVTPENAGWSFVGFKLVKLRPGDIFKFQTEGREYCLVPITGAFDASTNEIQFEGVGGRQNLFAQELTEHLFVPEKTRVTITATSDLELGICSAPGGSGLPARRIGRSDQAQSTRGQSTNTRYIHDILPETQPANSLLVVEVFTPAGNWSSYPPHKHCIDNIPEESALEETYYHRINPPQGFAFQRVYTDDLSIDETMAVEDGDCVKVPEGYHPVGAPHGYDNYYLNVMAGPKRVWRFKNDPEHEWMIR